MKDINKTHLFWIIPLCVIFGIIMGIYLMGIGMDVIVENYPVINCIMTGEDMLNINGNSLPFTEESQREALQWRCAKEYVDFNATYEETFEFTR